MKGALRGDVWLVDFGDPVGREQGFRRPAVVVSDDRLNAGPAGVVVVVPTTTRRRGLPAHVEIDARQSGLDETSYARCEDVRSVAEERLIAQIGHCPPDAMFRIERVLSWLLSLPPGR